MSLLEKTAPETVSQSRLTVMFLRDVYGPSLVKPQDPTQDRIVYSRGKNYQLPAHEAQHWILKGLAEPFCDASKAWCQSKGITDDVILSKFRETSLLMDKGEIHTTEPASISEPE